MEPSPAWPHAPTHRFPAGTYMVTAATYQKAHHFRGRERLDFLQHSLLAAANDFGWQLEAWAIFSNHYHFIGHSPENAPSADSLSDMIRMLHTKTGKWVNALDDTPVRRVRYNFWETHLTFRHSYYARLKYTHQNPVRHGLVPVANQYPWCSAAWFEHEKPAAFVNSIYRFKTDNLEVDDDFEVAM